MSEKQPLFFDPATVIPFNGYRRCFGEDRPVFDLVPSLIHFYESEKFRNTDEALRLSVLDCRTAKEAGKLTKRNKEHWRKDWRAVRGRVFRAGLAMQVVQSRKAMTMARAGYAQSIELAAYKRIRGLPGTFISEELQRFFGNSTGPGVTRLGVITLSGCVPDDIERRLETLFSKERPLSAAIYAGRDADPRVEMWCAATAIPVRLTSQTSSRLREEDAPEVTARVNALLTCMPPSRKGPIAILSAAASKRPKIRVLDLGLKDISPAPKSH